MDNGEGEVAAVYSPPVNNELCDGFWHRIKGSLLSSFCTVTQKNNPDIFGCNLKINYQILIIFGTNIPDTTWWETE